VFVKRPTKREEGGIVLVVVLLLILRRVLVDEEVLVLVSELVGCVGARERPTWTGKCMTLGLQDEEKEKRVVLGPMLPFF
jgi:hypothetical protein